MNVFPNAVQLIKMFTVKFTTEKSPNLISEIHRECMNSVSKWSIVTYFHNLFKLLRKNSILTGSFVPLE